MRRSPYSCFSREPLGSLQCVKLYRLSPGLANPARSESAQETESGRIDTQNSLLGPTYYLVGAISRKALSRLVNYGFLVRNQLAFQAGRGIECEDF